MLVITIDNNYVHWPQPLTWEEHVTLAWSLSHTQTQSFQYLITFSIFHSSLSLSSISVQTEHSILMWKCEFIDEATEVINIGAQTGDYLRLSSFPITFALAHLLISNNLI